MPTLTDRIAVIVSADTKGAAVPLGQLQKSAKETDTAFDSMSRSIGVSAKTLKTGLVAAAGALGAGALINFAKDSAKAFEVAQTAASQFARATNATVEEAGKFTTVVRAFGLEMNDLIEINAEFSQQIGDDTGALEELGVQIQKNADGSTNMTQTLVATVDALGAMEDGLRANQIAAELFGEEGSKQLAAFYNAGIQVSDLMKRINFVDNSAQAQAYTASTRQLNLAFEQLQITVGATLVPVMTTLADVTRVTAEALTAIPADVYLFAGAATVAYIAISRFGAALAYTATVSLFKFGLALQGGTVSMGLFSAASRGLAASLAAVNAALLANPVGIGLALLAGQYLAVSLASQYTTDRVEENIARFTELRVEGLSAANAIAQTAQEMEEASSIMDNFVAATGDKSALEWLFFWPNVVKDAVDALRDGGDDFEAYENTLKEITEQEGAAAAATADLTAQQKELNDAVADYVKGVGEWPDVAAAARTTNEALYDQALAADAAAIATGEYAVSVQQLVDYQADLVSRKDDVQGALESMTDAVEGLYTEPGKLVADDASTFQDEWEQAALGVEGSVYDVIQSMAEIGLSGDQIIQKFADMGVMENLPADVKARVQEALDEIEGLPTERVMTLAFEIDWTAIWADPVAKSLLTDGVEINGESRYDPTAFYQDLKKVQDYANGLLIPVTQQVTVEIDTENLEAEKKKVEAVFGEDVEVTPVIELDAQAAYNDIENAIGNIPVTLLPEVDQATVNDERGSLEDTFEIPVVTPVEPEVDDGAASDVERAVDYLTRDRTIEVDIQYNTPSGVPIEGLTTQSLQSFQYVPSGPGAQSASGPVTVTGSAAVREDHSTSFDLRGSTFMTADAEALYDELSSMSARRRMAGV